MIRVAQTPADFHDIMHGRKNWIGIPVAQLDTPLKPGVVLIVGLKDNGTAVPLIDCTVTHIHECIMAYVDPADEELITEPTVIVSIKRGINW